MRRRTIGLSSLLAASFLVTATGCESLRHTTRAHKDDKADAVKADPLDPKAIDADGTKVLAVESDGKTSGGSFFKNSRLPGAMSSEGRDIEKSLGVH